MTQILAWGSSYYLPAVLAKPIAADTGWPLPWVVGGLSLGLLVAGLVSPRVGRAIERRGGRPVLALASVLLAAGLAGLGLAPDLPAYLAAWVVIGLGMGAGLYDAAFATLGRLYGREARGAITNLTLFGGFASTVCWPLSAFLVGGARLARRLPRLRRAPARARPAGPPRSAAARAEAGRRTAPPSGSTGAAVRGEPTPSRRRAVLLLLAAALTLGAAIQGVVSVHLLTVLQARGADLAAAVALGALVGPSQVGARLVEKLLGARHHPIWTMLAFVVLVALGLGLLAAGLPVLARLPRTLRRRRRHRLDRAGHAALGAVRPDRLRRLDGSARDADAARRGFGALGRRPAAGAGRPPGALAALAGAALVNVVLVAALFLLVRAGAGVRTSP